VSQDLGKWIGRLGGGFSLRVPAEYVFRCKYSERF